MYSHPFEASGCSAAAREPDRAVLQLEALAERSREPPGTSTARRAVLQFRAFAERSGVGASAARDPDARRRRPYRRAVLGRGGAGASAEAALLSVLEAFAGKLVPPFMKLTRCRREPSSPEDMPADVHEAVEWDATAGSLVDGPSAREPREPLGARVLQGVAQPMLGRGGANSSQSTAHVYASGHGAAALPNHTDVTKTAVLQLLGRKEWLYCREAARARFAATLFPLEAAKLVKCETYDDAEMNSGALDCERVVTAPGDILFLPRRTVHSARAVDATTRCISRSASSPHAERDGDRRRIATT